jgi:hypothetical protein
MCRPIWAIIKEFSTINESTRSIRVWSHANNMYVNAKFKIKVRYLSNVDFESGMHELIRATQKSVTIANTLPFTGKEHTSIVETHGRDHGCIDLINLQHGVWSVWVGVNLQSCWKRYHKKRRCFDCSHTLVLYKIWIKVHWLGWQCKSTIRICYSAVLFRLSFMIKDNLIVCAYTWIWFFPPENIYRLWCWKRNTPGWLERNRNVRRTICT